MTKPPSQQTSDDRSSAGAPASDLHPSFSPNASGIRLTRIDWTAFLLVALASVFVTRVNLSLPPDVGVWQDDGIYLASSKSIADGHGYRRPELPGNPWQTKYPVLYPLLLAGIWKLWPDFPDNLAPLRILHGLLCFLGIIFCHLALRRSWRIPDVLAGAASLAAAVNDGWRGLIQTPMSEALFLPLIGLTLWMASPAPIADARIFPKPAWGRATIAGLAAAAAYLTRTIGVSLVAALVLSYLCRRQWRNAVLCALIGAAAVGGWQLWRRSADSENVSNPARAALAYELDYALWMPRDLSTAARVAFHNSSAISYSLYEVVLQPPLDGSVEPRLRGEQSGLPIYLPMLLLTALALLGLCLTFSPAAPTVHLFLFFYLILSAIWPFPPNRFILAIYPFIAASILSGLFLPAAALVRLFDQSAESSPTLLGALRRLGLSGFLASEQPGARIASGVSLFAAGFITLHHFNLVRLVAAEDSAGAAELRTSFLNLLKDQTPPDAVLACGQGGYLHLLTGRKFVLVLPMDDPISLLYSDLRRFRHCGNTSTQAESEHVRRWVASNLRAYHAAIGVTHVVVSKVPQSFNIIFRDYINANRSWWLPIADHPLGALYRFIK